MPAELPEVPPVVAEDGSVVDFCVVSLCAKLMPAILSSETRSAECRVFMLPPGKKELLQLGTG
jgi:hypothetical protein